MPNIDATTREEGAARQVDTRNPASVIAWLRHFGNVPNSLPVFSSVLLVLTFLFTAHLLRFVDPTCLLTTANRASTLRARPLHTAVWPCWSWQALEYSALSWA